jgi:hypothetical protein
MSFLRLNQLIVTYQGKEVYNQTFPNRINIIRGHNSSGKSTILNFIFFVLGGEFISFLPEALQCDHVFAELNINDAIITVKRDIDDKIRRPMYIYYGRLDKAILSAIEGWNVYPFNKTSQQESFSQIFFKLLEFPEISTDNQESITVNQILRLIYVDQLSSLDSLMRNEDFDSPTIRQAIGYLLLGTYDDNLLQKQISLRQIRKEFSEITSQVNAIADVFRNSPFEFDTEKLTNEISKSENQLTALLERLKEPEEIKTTKNETQNELNVLRNELLKIKKNYSSVAEEIDKLNIDILDSEEFILVYKEKLKAINESLNARNSFGNLEITYCPVCLEKLEEVYGENICHLCKREIETSDDRSKIVRLRLEIEAQIKESEMLLNSKRLHLNEKNDLLAEFKGQLKRAQSNYDIFVNQSRTTRDTIHDRLLEQKGNLIANVNFLNKQLQLLYSYEEYRIHQENLNIQISSLQLTIEQLEETQRSKAQVAFSKIEYYALELLKGDGNYESRFSEGRNIQLSFSKNTFYLDGRNRFSASSMVLLKNCVRFAIFFASVELDFFRYPKLIICDNIEDKGMEPLRSKNFQRNIVNLAESETFKDKDFQIIFSTSMIDDSLNNEKYTIGSFYDDQNHSLKF